MAAADFSNLPEDILDKIVGHHLEATFPTHIAFAAVCKSWRSAALLPHNLRCRGRPGILLSPKRRREVTTTATNNNSPPCGPPHKYFPDLQLIKPWETSSSAATSFDNIGTDHCLASNDGWLVLAGRPGPGRGGFISLYLLNPVTGEKVVLPHLNKRRRRTAGLKDIHKAILSCSPHDDGGCYVFLFFNSGSELGWFKVDSSAAVGSGWKFAGDHHEEDSRIFKDVPEDASYSAGKLYVLAGDVVYVLDNLAQDVGPNVRAVIPFSPAMKSPSYEARTSPYACHVNDQLHVILLRRRRRLQHGESCTSDRTTFHVFKLLQENDDVHRSSSSNSNWERVRSLDGHAVFLGTRQCFSVPTNNDDEVGSSSSLRIVRNCIYFALNGCSDLVDVGEDYYWDWCRYDRGVFNLDDEVNQSVGYSHGHYNCVWFFPMPWDISKHKIHT